MNLQIPQCVTLIGTSIHEFMHSLGFFHEHARADRDKSVDILYQNVREEYRSQFVIANQNDTNFAGPYDFGSIMHYSLFAFSKEPKVLRTIHNKVPIDDGIVIGQRRQLSKFDIDSINFIYCNITASERHKSHKTEN